MALYSPSLWRYLTDGLTELTDGRGDTMLALADVYMGPRRRGPLHQRTDAQVGGQLRRPAAGHRPGRQVIEEDRRSRVRSRRS